MRCAALFGGRPERGAAGLANDVRSSHVLIVDSCDAVGERSPVLYKLVLFSGQSRRARGYDAKLRPTTRTDRFVTNFAGMRPAPPG